MARPLGKSWQNHYTFPMRKQQEIWEREHIKQEALPSMASVEPDHSVVAFAEYLADYQIKPLRWSAVDIGCGKGRNAIYLATLGYEVYGLDYIQLAIDTACQLAEERNVSNGVHLFRTEIDKPWPFVDHSFDVAIDCFSSIDIETEEGRVVYRQEMYRTLKPGGYALVTAVSADDEIESELIKRYPGEEKNSTLWPTNGKFQKDYSEEELRVFYREFYIAELRTIQQPAVKLGREFTATNYWMVLKKPE
jgi:SAM-dependent methyltransferase